MASASGKMTVMRGKGKTSHKGQFEAESFSSLIAKVHDNYEVLEVGSSFFNTNLMYVWSGIEGREGEKRVFRSPVRSVMHPESCI